MSLHGVQLDQNLVDIKNTSRGKYNDYKNKIKEAQKFCRPSLQQIPITVEERTKFQCIHNQPRREIYKECVEVIKMLNNRALADHYSAKITKIKVTGKKDNLVAVYLEVSEFLNEQLTTPPDSSELNEVSIEVSMDDE